MHLLMALCQNYTDVTLYTGPFDTDRFSAEKVVCCKINLWHRESFSFQSHTNILCGHEVPDSYNLLII